MASDSIVVEVMWPTLLGAAPGERATWLPVGERDRLLMIARTEMASGGALSAEPLRRTSRALWRTGWFEGEPTVTRTPEGVTTIEGEWRVPAAAVRFEGRDRLIAWGGYPLALVYPRGQSGLRVVLGAGIGPSEESGAIDPSRPWPGEDVTAALALLELLEGEGLDDQLAAVDVGRLFHDGMLELVTTRGGRVVWGAPVGRFAPGQKSDAERLDILRELIKRTGMLDAGEDRLEIFGPRVEIDRSGG